MAQWDKLCNFLQCQENSEALYSQLNSFYDSQGFSATLREDFALWIEKQQWDSPEIAYSPNDILQSFLDEINRFIPGKHVPFVKKQEYRKFLKSLENAYGSDPGKFIEVMKRCLKTEDDILKTNSLVEEQPMRLSPDVYLRQRIKAINDNTKEVDWAINNLDILRLSVTSNSNKKREYEKTLVSMRSDSEQKREVATTIDQLRKNIEKETVDLTQKYADIQQKEKLMIQDVGDIATEMIDEHLNRWKVFQKYPPLKDAPNAMKTISLDSFVNLFGEIFELLILMKQQLNRYYQQAEYSFTCSLNIMNSEEEKQQFISCIQEFINEINGIIKKLFNNCIVIEEQPPQIIKVETKSGKSRELRILLRCLLSSTYLHFGEVITEFRNEQELNPFLTSTNKKATRATINGGVGKFTTANRMHSLLFEKLRVENFRRTGNDEIVTEQKYGLRFCVDIKLSQMTVPIKIISLPIIVCCHTSQECSAQASILWYNAFSTMDAKPFEVERSVPWDQFKQILDLELQSKMSHEGRHGRGFSEENFDCIREMLGVDPNDDSASVSWEKFNKDLLPPKNKFSFWKWFLATINLINHHFRNVWNDGLVHGYLSKEQAADMLTNCQPGTFALRFSSSYIDARSIPSAGLSVVLVVKKEDGIGNDIINCQPFTSQKHFSHFKEENFGTMLHGFLVNDEHSLRFLYPDKPIEQEFAKYYQPEDEDYNGDEYNPIQISFKAKGNQRNVMMRNTHRLNSASDAGSVCSPAPSQQSNHMEFDSNGPLSPPFYPLSPQSTVGDVGMNQMGRIMGQKGNPTEEVTQLLQRLNSQPLGHLSVGNNQNNSANNFSTFDHQWAVPESVGEITVETRLNEK
ncbi:signal transducer and activator of transcription 5A-like isoform X2 [Lineus longissimus]|uniref:signal transducer and activator of transcription 5A-like isoform X2 n=1 Tax=Lineus longissimus TaxID=88925 RepID=UPI00315D3BAF